MRYVHFSACALNFFPPGRSSLYFLMGDMSFFKMSNCILAIAVLLVGVHIHPILTNETPEISLMNIVLLRPNSYRASQLLVTNRATRRLQVRY